MLNVFLLGSGKALDRAIILMADGLILLWIIIGGLLTPMFIAWALMLSWWKFTPVKVLLLFGITGSIAEASIQPSNLIGGFWVFVYWLMVYLPACTVLPWAES